MPLKQCMIYVGFAPWQPYLGIPVCIQTSGLQEVGSSCTEGGVDKTKSSA